MGGTTVAGGLTIVTGGEATIVAGAVHECMPARHSSRHRNRRKNYNQCRRHNWCTGYKQRRARVRRPAYSSHKEPGGPDTPTDMPVDRRRHTCHRWNKRCRQAPAGKPSRPPADRCAIDDRGHVAATLRYARPASHLRRNIHIHHIRTQALPQPAAGGRNSHQQASLAVGVDITASTATHTIVTIRIFGLIKLHLR